MSRIHPTAVIESGAQLDSTVEVGAYSVIGANVRIDAGTKIGPHVVIEGHTTIGRDNQIFQFGSLGAAPQDKKYAGEPTRLEIGDRNTIREFVTFNLGTTQDAGVTRIGDDNWIMAYVHLAHDCQLGNNIILANNATLAGHVHLGDWVFLGGFTSVHQFCHIGAHAMTAFTAAVSQDVPPFVTAAGNRHEWRHILAHCGGKGRHRMRADVAELMHRGKAAEEHPVAQMHVAGERGVVGQNDIVAELAIVRQMHVSHDPVVATYRRVAFDHHMRTDLGAGVDPHMGADHRIGADLDRGVELSARLNDGARMNARHGLACLAGVVGVAHGAHQVTLNRDLAVNGGNRLVLPDTARTTSDFHMHLQLVARLYRTLEARIVDTDEIHHGIGVGLTAFRQERQQGRGLRQRFDHQHDRHHRLVWKMTVEELFVHSHVLDGGDVLAAFPCQYAIDQQQRIAVREVFFDLIDVETSHCSAVYSI